MWKVVKDKPSEKYVGSTCDQNTIKNIYLKLLNYSGDYRREKRRFVVNFNRFEKIKDSKDQKFKEELSCSNILSTYLK